MMKSLFAVTLFGLALASQRPAVQEPLTNGILPPSTSALEALPLLGFGTWNLDRSNATEAVSWAIHSGYRHIDCAAIYGNEPEVGMGIRWGLESRQLSRGDIWVTSKLWNDMHGDFKTVEAALDKTLLHLGVEYLDLYHMHWPVSEKKSGSNKIEYHKTWESMTALLATGKVRHIGVSNFSPAQLEDLLNHTSVQPAVHQMEMHPYLQQNEFLAMHQKLGIHVTAYSPLGGTNPTYKPGAPPALLSENKTVKKIAKKRGCTPAQVVLQWGLRHGTSVIPKSQHADRITENYQSVYCHLKAKDLRKLGKLESYHHRYNNPAKGWGVNLYDGLEDSKGKHKIHS